MLAEQAKKATIKDVKIALVRTQQDLSVVFANCADISQ
jgi:hypothetical protein